MAPSTRDLVFLIGAGALIGTVGLPALGVGPALGLLAGGAQAVAGNWAADISLDGWRRACARLGRPDELNHDLQRALMRAFGKAVTAVEKEWKASSERRGRDARRDAESAFDGLRRDARALAQ